LYDGTIGQYIRITPISHHGTANCMRTELYGVQQAGGMHGTMTYRPNTWPRGDMKFIFQCSSLISHEWAQRKSEISSFNTTKINSYLQASMYYFVYYINISLKSRKTIVEIADSLKLDINTCENLSYQNTYELIRFFSVAEIPIILRL
jgi:hypothetical protein